MTVFLVFTSFWEDKWTSEDVMIFFFFFGLHVILGGKVDVGRRDDLFLVFT